eukprot:TRINITY_DN21016_c2_g1_i1.p1 TRINITY_DN21016_c2_g1~~TRINITY_DN21016_c2_g1_i1.p1  ORF type:complete len:405 (+),score=51.52 TRINITY_DN21016_c2_g1_i1:57-1217(+)
MNQYTKIEKLGEGGQGKVYKVRRKADNVVVVLKMINCTERSYLKHAMTEVEVMRNLRHPHLVSLVDHFTYQGNTHKYICIVMPHYPNGDLFKKFCEMKSAKGRFSEPILIKYLTQICSGLQYLHGTDSWHRDVKASNVLIDAKGDLRLADFGLSATYSNKGHATVVGTPFYFAPEIMLHEKYTNKIDIWNVGVLLLELITLRQHPINVEVLCEKSETQKKILSMVTERGYSKMMAMLVSSMLAKNASDRPSAREVMQQLPTCDTNLIQGDSSPQAQADLRSRLKELDLCCAPPKTKPAKTSSTPATTVSNRSGSSGDSGGEKPLTPDTQTAAMIKKAFLNKQQKMQQRGNPRREHPKQAPRGLCDDQVVQLQDKLQKIAITKENRA